jgi:tetratricopeptide (TPR) repeat protein
MKKNTAMTPNEKPYKLKHSLKVHMNWFVFFMLLSQVAIFPVLAQNNAQNNLIKGNAEKNLEVKNNETTKAQSQEMAFFNAATQAYNASNFELAIDYYEKIIAAGYHSPELYYNLGNVYYKQNEIALSIYYFEKSLLLNPNDQEVIKNLGFAQKMTLDAIPSKEVNGHWKSLFKSH